MFSEPQKRIFEAVKSGKGHVAVQATAGAGKSTTLIESSKLIPRFRKNVFLSFSNFIVNELKDKLPTSIQASTLHSLGYRMILNRFKKVDVRENKYFEFALKHFKDRDKEVYKKCFGIQEICNYARLTRTPFEYEDISTMCNYYGIDAGEEEILIASIILNDHCNLRSLYKVDFADMIVLPSMFPELVNFKYDNIFYDESQDANAAQIEFINRLLKPTGRLIFCGDENQAIYGFTGSDINSFSNIEKRFNSNRLALTVTYRCPKEVVKLAKQIYPDAIDPWDQSPDGVVRKGDIMEAEEGDMIICRNTKPLIQAFFYLLDAGRKSYLVGKDFHKGLMTIINSIDTNDTIRFENRLDEKLDDLSNELKSNGVNKPVNNPKYVALAEKVDVIKLILQKCNSVYELKDRINQIFDEDKKAITLMTIHRCKGAERDRVFFIEYFDGEKLCPSKYALLDWQKKQEDNLLFVAYTRAKREFIRCEL